MDSVYSDVALINQKASERVWLNLFARSCHCRVGGVIEDVGEEELRTVLTAAGFTNGGDLNAVQYHLENEMGVQEAPLVLVLNKSGRSLAYQGGNCEYAVLYKGTKSFSHELMHLFGAKDYYTSEQIKAVAQNCFGESIMLSSATSKEVDDLTAYLIGWTDMLSAAASGFLDATNYLTEQDLYEIHQNNAVTGNGTLNYPNGSVYTGDLEKGIANGRGTLVFADGTTYSGDFVWGAMSGQGSMRYPDGTVYTGSFLDGVYSGAGTLVYSDGAWYQGNFANGRFEGSGTLCYPDGASYSGQFSAGKQHGYGVFRWADGACYEGEYYQNAMHGYGTLHYPDGRSLSGNWNQGSFVG